MPNTKHGKWHITGAWRNRCTHRWIYKSMIMNIILRIPNGRCNGFKDPLTLEDTSDRRLNITKRIRFNNDDELLMQRLKQLKIKPSKFIRQAFREKIKNDLPKLIIEEEKRKSKDYCPF